ncbi:hypothetical protein [Tannockella kyphosi]|uniref:hypothetical protein n=1 Tax=Tannockella kyphosi TaxID=2899121 RepID=UPI002012E469|nr:hypothetical protein [Tannockella kyphosi]
MHIQTYTKETMIDSLCRYLDVSEESLLHQISSAAMSSDIFCQGIKEFVKQCRPVKKLDKILFFHLGRRLNSDINDNGLNLRDLLLNKTALSDYLASYKIAFQENNNYIEIYYKGVLQELDLDNYSSTANVARLKVRLGYYQDRQDYCFNGFSLKDQLHQNSYYTALFSAPEFISDLAVFLKFPSVLKDYTKNSTYYCYEYLVPLSEVMFDNNDKLSDNEKVLFLIEKVCLRIYEYNSRYIYDHENPILRLDDNASMHKEYFVSKEEIMKG